MHSNHRIRKPDWTTDQDLLHSLQSDKNIAMDRIFLMFYRPLCFFATEYVQNSSLAEDIVFYAFRRLRTVHGQINSLPAVKAFLYIYTKNACLDHLRQQPQAGPCMLELAYLPSIHPDEGRLVDVLLVQLTQEMNTALESLQPGLKKILLLYLKGMDARGISAELKMSMQSVRNYKSKAVKLLNMRMPFHLFCLLNGGKDGEFFRSIG